MKVTTYNCGTEFLSPEKSFRGVKYTFWRVSTHYACAIAALMQKRLETFAFDQSIVCDSALCGYVCMFLSMSCVLSPRNKPFTCSKTPHFSPIGLNPLRVSIAKSKMAATWKKVLVVDQNIPISAGCRSKYTHKASVFLWHTQT